MKTAPVKVTFLGTGTSHGIPMIGCDCPVCTSPDAHDRRTRPSILVETAGVCLLVDTAPELRLQCVANRVRQVDAVLFTHAHADHVTGMDDLRRFNWLSGDVLPAYGNATTLAAIERMFAYIFRDEPDYPSHKPALTLTAVGHATFDVGGCTVTPIPLLHGNLPVLGYRFADVAYCTDCNAIPAESFERLCGLDLLILDALRKRPHPTHFNLTEAVAMAQRVAARRTLFTHIAHELAHAETNAGLPAGMALAHDGQVVFAPDTPF